MKNQLHPGAKWLFRLKAYFVLAFLAIFSALWAGPFLAIALAAFYPNAFSFSLPVILSTIFLYIIGIFAIGEIYATMAYNRWFYEFTPDNLKIERGIIWKRYSNIPYERVQNVDITRGIIARMLGFSTANIQTAGYSYSSNNSAWSEGYIPAVEMNEAEKIREFVMKKIGRRNKGGL